MDGDDSDSRCQQSTLNRLPYTPVKGIPNNQTPTSAKIFTLDGQRFSKIHLPTSLPGGKKWFIPQAEQFVRAA